MKNAVVGNWITTLLGVLGAFFNAWQDYIKQGMSWKTAAVSALILVFGIVCKDFNSTSNLGFFDKLILKHGEDEVNKALNSLLEKSKATAPVILLCLLLSFTAWAQSVVPATPTAPAPTVTTSSTATPVLPTNIFAAGISFAPAASPVVAGTGLYARLASGSLGTYVFTSVDALPANESKWQFSTSVGAGVAQKIFTLTVKGKSVPIFIPVSAGVAITGSNTGWTWATGAMPIIGLKEGYKIMPAIRVVKNNVGVGYSPIFSVMFGWGQ